MQQSVSAAFSFVGLIVLIPLCLRQDFLYLGSVSMQILSGKDMG